MNKVTLSQKLIKTHNRLVLSSHKSTRCSAIAATVRSQIKVNLGC